MAAPILRRLDSGLVVVVQPLPHASVTSAHLWFEAGSADESPEQSGAAHFVEHLLFKGTPTRGIGEAAAQIEGLGGDLNAWTSLDETCLHATVADDATDLALEVLFDMARNALFDPDELERERLVVLEEIRGYQDDPDGIAADRLAARLFGGHAYGRPVLGTPETVGALTPEALRSFWHSHYHPGRATLTVAGPIEPDAICAIAGALSAGWPVGASRAVLRPPRPQPAGAELVDRDFGSVVVTLGWPTAAAGHDDVAALDVLAQGLAQGASSRLVVRLELEAGVASHVWAANTTLRTAGQLSVGFVSGETEDALRAALHEIRRVAAQGLSPGEVRRARDGLLADLLFTRETTDGLAGDLAWATARAGGPDGTATYRAALQRITPADVARVAARYLDPERAQIVVIDRTLDQDRLSAVVQGAPVPGPATKRSPSGSSGGAELYDLDGLRVALLPTPSEVVGLRILGLGGQLLERGATAGLAEAWSRTVVRAGGALPAVPFAERADSVALWLSAGAGRSVQGLTASFPAIHTEAALALIGDVLLEPRFDEDDWDNVREAMLDDIAAQIDLPVEVGNEALWRGLWPRHPWRNPFLGTPSTLEGLTTARLQRLHTSAMAADNLVIAIAGGFDPDAVLRLLSGWAEALPPHAAPLEPPIPADPGRSARIRHAGTKQAAVILGVRGVAADHPDRTALAVACHLLDSQSGRLFLHLREARGLAYSVWAQSDAALGGGTFSAGLSTDPERVGEASRALRLQLRRLAEDGPDPGELARTTRMIAGLAAMRHERVSSRAIDLASAVRRGRPYGLDALRQRLASLSPADVQGALQRLELSAALRVTVLPRSEA